MKVGKVFLVLFLVLYIFGVILRIAGLLLLGNKDYKNWNWKQIFLLGELSDLQALEGSSAEWYPTKDPRWFTRIGLMIVIPLAFSLLIVNRKIKLS